MSAFDFDLFTIGAGSGGVRAARLAGAMGLRSGLAEAWTVGGTCVHRGCIPKKLYAYASHFSESFEDALAYGWSVGTPSFDWSRLVAAKRKELARLEGIYSTNLKKAGVALFPGRAVLEDPHTVRIGDARVHAARILIATGGRPWLPTIPGIELAITSDEVFDLPRLPESILIAGGGYIAVELACIFNGLGVDTTVVYRGEGVLRGFDDDLRVSLEEEMRARGIRFRFHTVFEAIERQGAALCARTPDGESLSADQILMAVGRRPNTEGLGLAEAGVRLGGKGEVLVDAFSTTSVSHIHAIGDVTDRLNLTPVAIHEAICLIDTLFGGNPRTPDHGHVPTAVFTHPEIGTVGMTEAEARSAYPEVEIYKTRFRPLKHSLTGRETRAMIKLVVDRQSRRVLGAHLLCAEAAEMVQSLAIAVKAGLTKEQFDATMALHPTTSEELVLLYEPST